MCVSAIACFLNVAAYRIFSQNLSDTRQAVPPEQIDTAFVTQDFLPLLGVAPFLGSGFSQEQFRENAEQVVILDYGLWQHHFGSDRDMVGRLITLHGAPHRVAGVMPMGFSFPESVQAWAPLTDDMAFPQNRRAHLFTTLASAMRSTRARYSLGKDNATRKRLGVVGRFILISESCYHALLFAVRESKSDATIPARR